MKKTYTIFYKSGNKVRVKTSRLTIVRDRQAEWMNDGNILVISPDDIDAIVKGKQ